MKSKSERKISKKHRKKKKVSKIPWVPSYGRNKTHISKYRNKKKSLLKKKSSISVLFGYTNYKDFHGPLEKIIRFCSFKLIIKKLSFVCRDFYLASKASFRGRYFSKRTTKNMFSTGSIESHWYYRYNEKERFKISEKLAVYLLRLGCFKYCDNWDNIIRKTIRGNYKKFFFAIMKMNDLKGYKEISNYMNNDVFEYFVDSIFYSGGKGSISNEKILMYLLNWPSFKNSFSITKRNYFKFNENSIFAVQSKTKNFFPKLLKKLKIFKVFYETTKNILSQKDKQEICEYLIKNGDLKKLKLIITSDPVFKILSHRMLYLSLKVYKTWERYEFKLFFNNYQTYDINVNEQFVIYLLSLGFFQYNDDNWDNVIRKSIKGNFKDLFFTLMKVNYKGINECMNNNIVDYFVDNIYNNEVNEKIMIHLINWSSFKDKFLNKKGELIKNYSPLISEYASRFVINLSKKKFRVFKKIYNTIKDVLSQEEKQIFCDYFVREGKLKKFILLSNDTKFDIFYENNLVLYNSLKLKKFKIAKFILKDLKKKIDISKNDDNPFIFFQTYKDLESSRENKPNYNIKTLASICKLLLSFKKLRVSLSKKDFEELCIKICRMGSFEILKMIMSDKRVNRKKEHFSKKLLNKLMYISNRNGNRNISMVRKFF